MSFAKQRIYSSVFNSQLASLTRQAITLGHFKQRFKSLRWTDIYKAVQNTRRKTIYQKTHITSSQFPILGVLWTIYHEVQR